ncbi:DarT ssDNA thymidine ADP-ribosyltransferase family protein [Thiohalospira halophila]|uniref:DarT ssDNA thymidine ADP-ribosyltransferase family protein n=1 Tax=Thiohalospira halophila TaxID=381300 RepID=UPI000A59E090|nr:DarT ssDNA thymidine ADP-ribosyltransferase family protein [Thiohalospira halophila]
MPSIKDQKLLYHLTSLANVGAILDSGLQPRAALDNFRDVADAEILAGRGEHDLDGYVPFHWFSRNPFDGRVQNDQPHEDFVLVTVHRTLAEERNWKIIPSHPLGRQGFEIYDYQEGFEIIDWDLMDLRDYHDPDCKSVCVAECLSPEPVSVSDFFKIFVSTEQVRDLVLSEASARGQSLEVVANPNMFRQ